ncbi:MAG: hypothetical protein GXO33_00440 [Epsilonproteobacteria bacterium]|nr:hypothetical protein [Campylobacterota bacterium]
MITWMQKHRKYLVITIWISTIAFVGAGFVGWGTYQYGSMSNNVAKVGDVEISVESFQQAYRNTYEQYNRMLGGNLDEATAKKLGLQKQVLQSLVYQALIENFAKEHGIIVTDEEVQKAIFAIPAFQKNGAFDKATYLAVLQGMRLKPKSFEANLKKELLLKKTLSLLSPAPVQLEKEAVGAALFIADKIRYRVLNAADITVQPDEKALKAFWETHKDRYMTPTRYTLALLWVTPEKSDATESEIADYYKAHRTDFTDTKGEILPLDKVKERVAEAVALKHAKKKAQLAYIDLKKGRRQAESVKTFDESDPFLNPDVWAAVKGATPGTTLKPKVVNGRYLVIKVEKIDLPKPKSFEEARAEAEADYIRQTRIEKLKALAQKSVENLQQGKLSPWLTRDNLTAIPELDKEETARFLEKLFESQKKRNSVTLGEKAVAYEIVEQQLLDNDKLSKFDAVITKNSAKIKAALLQNGLIKRLEQKYPIEIFLKENQ